MAAQQPRQPQNQQEWVREQFAHMPTTPIPAMFVAPYAPPLPDATAQQATRKQRITRVVALALVLALGVVLYFTWRAPASATNTPTSITQQNFGTGNQAKSTNTTPTTATTGGNGGIQAYIVGDVKHPGVYTLPVNARVYDLVQAAGGTLPDANLVALNLAARLTDGQEVYVTKTGEKPPTYVGGVPGPATDGTGTGQLVNINSATVDELRLQLRITSTVAQNIVNYRLQHGPYTSVDQLASVVSKVTYTRIKNMVTV